jgi:hypothetical protein
MNTRCTLNLRDGMHMAISFPNTSRAYDATRHAVRFWGYDSAMETSFFIDERALKHVQADMQFDEVGLLRAFDLNHEQIFETAAKVYARGNRGSYDLTFADF